VSTSHLAGSLRDCGAGDVDKDTCLVLDPGGYPHISYYDETDDDLKYACKDSAG
jgi:hypothetical protein